MQPVAEAGVVPIGGPQSGIVITAATALVLPTSAQRAQIAGPGTEFKIKATGILVCWLTVELQDARFDVGVAPSTGTGLLLKQTAAPVIFTGERLLRALQFISVVAGGTISYRFFFKENA
jgi:hypothetical protein